MPTTYYIEHFRSMAGMLQLYSVRREQDTYSFADDFYTRMPKKVAQDPQLQNQWVAFVTNLQRIAQRGTSLFHPNCLRIEKSPAHALPSKGRFLRSLGLAPPIDFRLYCYAAGPRTLVLLGGDIKTADDPHNCPNVRPYFQFSGAIARALEKQDDFWEIDANNRFNPDPFVFDY